MTMRYLFFILAISITIPLFGDDVEDRLLQQDFQVLEEWNMVNNKEIIKALKMDLAQARRDRSASAVKEYESAIESVSGGGLWFPLAYPQLRHRRIGTIKDGFIIEKANNGYFVDRPGNLPGNIYIMTDEVLTNKSLQEGLWHFVGKSDQNRVEYQAYLSSRGLIYGDGPGGMDTYRRFDPAKVKRSPIKAAVGSQSR